MPRRPRPTSRAKKAARSGTAPTPARSPKVRFLPLLILVAGAVVYANSLSGVFLFDDERYIVRNPRIQQLWPPAQILGSRRPVADVTLAVNYAYGGLEVRGYHAVNVTIHVLAALTLFGVVRRTLLRAGEQGHLGQTAHWLALITALAWVVHPLQTQSVTYIVQRCESLMGLFYLLTLYCVIRGAGSARPYLWQIAAVVACALGMGSKAVMVTAPLVVFLFDGVFVARSWRRAIRLRWAMYLGLVATWGVLWHSGVVSTALDPSATKSTVGFGFKGVTPLAYALTQPGVILHYLRLSFWPYPQCLDYGWPTAASVDDVLMPALVIGALLFATAWALLRRSWMGFVGAWFFVILAPTSSFVPIADAAFEHRMYLPLAAVIVLVVAGGQVGLGRLFLGLGVAGRSRRWITVVLVTFIVSSLGYGTMRRNRAYASEITMWSDALKHRPDHARIHDNLGAAYQVAGRHVEGIRHYREAIRLNAASPDTHFNLATALFELGRLDDAVEAFRETIRLNPRHVLGYISLGNALAARGALEEALPQYRRAIQIHPRATAAHVNLGNALSSLGRLEEAVAAYEAALRIEPEYADAYYNLGNVLLRLRRSEDAAGAYREALRVRRDLFQAHAKLGDILAARGNPEEAVELYGRALQLNPNYVPAHVNLGNELLRLGQRKAAIRHYREALRIAPLHAQAQQALQGALATEEQSDVP